MLNDKERRTIQEAVTIILSAVGEDISRPGLADTPLRVAKMYEEIFSSLKEPAFDDFKLFESQNHGDLVIVKDIQFYSMCEHHLLPFFGNVHIGYIPEGNKVLGLSKFPRLVEYCAKRPSVQEDLTVMIATQLATNIPAKGIAVAIEAEHMCMTMRGVRSPHSLTKTFHYSGVLETNRDLQRQFLEEVRNR